MTSWNASSTRGVYEHVVDGCEVRAEGQVVEIGVGFGGSKGGVDQFAVVARERDVPLLEDLLECVKLAGGQFVAEAARTAV